MLLSEHLQWIKSEFKRRLGFECLWHLSPKRLMAMPLGLCCICLVGVVGASYGLMILQEKRFQVELKNLDTDLLETMEELMPVLGQGGWLGLAVMPALASPLPLPDLEQRFADMRFLSRQVRRYRVAELQIEPVPSQDLWRIYRLNFHADASQWISILSHLSLLPGLQLKQQQWTNDGQAALQIRLAGELPETVVGQVSGSSGEARLLLKEGRLQRSEKPGRSFQNDVH